MKEAVAIIIFNEDKDQVLLIKRRDIPVWVIPGGGIDPGESPEQAALREAKEETGCSVTLLRKSAEYLPKNRLTTFTHLFEAHIIGGHPTIGPETKEIAFFHLATLPKHFPPFYRHFLTDAKALSPSPIQKTICGTSYLHMFKFIFTHPLLTLRFFLTRLGIHLNS